TARTSCGSGMNRHFQWPKPLKMKKTKNHIFRFRLAKWPGRPFCKCLEGENGSVPGLRPGDI
ncbi:MAG: hypothetical protein KJ558_16625, partial [Gammaproteobacteria bacterium]|nr:hypothetical protein [Gammaproteobacteria bacterium]MBU1960040.1 hypothetical protein [Gammaproteobacteria bacterium]